MQCPRCQGTVAESSNYCAQCGCALTPTARESQTNRAQQIAQTAVENAKIPPPLNPNTFSGYLQTQAGEKAFSETLGFFKEWMSQAYSGFRATLIIFAIVLSVLVGALVFLGETHTLTPSVGTVFGLLIGFVLGKMPSPSGGGGSKPQQ